MHIYTMAINEDEPQGIVFLHRVVAGSAGRSYGVHVAKLAGMPPSIVQRAEAVLHQLEARNHAPATRHNSHRNNSMVTNKSSPRGNQYIYPIRSIRWIPCNQSITTPGRARKHIRSHIVSNRPAAVQHLSRPLTRLMSMPLRHWMPCISYFYVRRRAKLRI